MAILVSRYGTTAENNAWVYPKGIVTQDTEAGALRLHDGLTPGGWVVPGTPAELPNGPGPTTLQAGDTTAGFYGEVPTADLIDGNTLASELGLTAGTAQNSTSPWLKFNLDGKTLFVAKNTYRYNLLWQDIDTVSAVYGGTEVTVGDNIYRVRLLTGGDADPASAAGGEWNALFYPISEEDPNTQGWGVNYTPEELLGTTGAGTRTWCQEASVNSDFNYPNEPAYIIRGNGPSDTHHFNGLSGLNGTGDFGWRPVLELVE